jgi:hypothetical protein
MKTNKELTAKPAISYYIRAEFFYYGCTYGAPQNGALRDQAGNRLEFASREEAVAYLCEKREEWNYDTAMGCEENGSGYSFAGTYICRHGEYARPVYRIRKVPVGKGAAQWTEAEAKEFGDYRSPEEMSAHYGKGACNETL